MIWRAAKVREVHSKPQRQAAASQRELRINLSRMAKN